MKQLRAPGPGGVRAAARWLVAAATLVAMGAASGGAFAAEQTVHRCEIDGRVIFQQKACAPGQAGRVVAVPPTNVATAPVPAASRPAAPAPAAATAAASAPVPPASPPVSDEQLCLAYLQPLLRDPASARIVTSAREGRILRVQLQAADAHGRLQTRDAACEFFNGRIDEGWSRIQLERLGWFAPRSVVHGSSRAARRAARAREESIEAPPP